MANKTIIRNAEIVNEGKVYHGYVEIAGELISKVGAGEPEKIGPDVEIVDAGGKYLLPGVIDEHVHFRDPGLTYKADILTESYAASAGGVTSYFDMPNCKPATTTNAALRDKYERASKASAVNYSFYIGATNDNFGEIESADYGKVCGVKLFLGSSTGGMLVNESGTIDRLLRFSRDRGIIVAVHSEDENIIKANIVKYREKYGENVPVRCHPEIRSEEACYAATARIVEAADRVGARLHVLHISTEKELSLFDSTKGVADKKITAEACVAHLLFSDSDYERLGSRIKCNPAVKTTRDRDALRKGLIDGRIDVVATDHAPHLLSDKEGGSLKAASGMPMIQYSLVTMLDIAASGVIGVSDVARLMSQAPARLYGVEHRGYIREGYYADLTLVERLEEAHMVVDAEVVSRCGWTPLDGSKIGHRVVATWVNGNQVYNQGVFSPLTMNYAQQISFRR